MTDEFYSPYQFLPLNTATAKATTERTSYRDIAEGNASHIRHDSYASNSRSGRILCSVTTKSPCAFLDGSSETNSNGPITRQLYVTNSHGRSEAKSGCAIPANTLKSAITRTAEYISASPLRVLDNEQYHRRDAVAESCKALGLIRNDGVDGITLVPLAMHAVPGNAQKNDVSVDSCWAKIFDLDTPAKKRFVSYVGNYPRPHENTNDHALQKMLDDEDNPLPSFQYSHNRKWCWLKTEDEPKKPRKDQSRKPALLQCPRIGNLEWDEKKVSDEYTKGCLYITGGGGQRSKMESKANKKHELFIPLDPDAPVYRKVLTVTDTHIADFELIADDRKAASDRERQNYTETREGSEPSAPAGLPFMPIGYQENRADTLGYWKDGKQHQSRIADGDIVYFEIDDHGDLTRISYSAIWRQRIPGDVWQSFDAIAPDLPTLLPWHSKRESLAAVESLFGVIEMQPDTGRSRNLKGRVEVSAAHHIDGVPLVSEPILLRELSSPKAPSRQMYWRNEKGSYIEAKGFKLGTGDYADKPELSETEKMPTVATDGNVESRDEVNRPLRGSGVTVLPLGIKFYTCFKDSEIEAKPWQHPLHDKLREDPLDAEMLKATRRCSKVPLIEKDQTFDFHIDFHNLNDEELGLLLSSINPLQNGRGDDRFYHRIGYGKPLGLGHVTMQINGIFYVDRPKRYSADGLLGSRYHAIAADTQGTALNTLIGSPLESVYPSEITSVASIKDVQAIPYESEYINAGNLRIWRGAGNPAIREGDLRPVCYPFSLLDAQRPAINIAGQTADANVTPLEDTGEGFKWIVAVEAISRKYENSRRMGGYINKAINSEGHPHRLNAKVEGNRYRVLLNHDPIILNPEQMKQLEKELRIQLGAERLTVKTSRDKLVFQLENCKLPLNMPQTVNIGEQLFRLEPLAP